MRGRGNKAVGYVVIKCDNFKIKILSSVSLHALQYAIMFLNILNRILFPEYINTSTDCQLLIGWDAKMEEQL
jgi:hypothetical protein